MAFYGFIITIIIMIIILLVYFLWEVGKHSAFIKKRLAKAIAGVTKATPGESARSPLTEALAKKTEVLINRFIPANIIRDIEQKIVIARIKDFTAAKYFLLKAIIMVFIIVFFPLYFSMLGVKTNQGLLLMFLGLGFFFPDLMLKSKIAKLHKVILRELPNFIDLLRVCVEAGLDMEGALSKLVEKSSGALRDETAQVTSEIRMGKSVPEALQDMAKRISLPDFSSFITLIIQANQMGISVSNVLRSQARQISIKQTQALRAKAAKIPVMILIPMVLFILPSLLVVIIGPAIIQVINVF
ncbi:type II secretion system F family protein [Candidatus Margulisiibacteriota bacterium]